MSVIFDQLRISDDGKQLYINAHVNTADYFDSYYLDELIIMTADKVLESEDPFCASSNPENYVYYKKFGDADKRVDLVLPDLNWTYPKSDLSKELFFVYIKCKEQGPTNVCKEYLPCSLTSQTTLGVTFDENMLYQKVMDFTKQLAKDCTVPQGFTDFILLWNAFKASVETEHYKPAIKYFNQLFDLDSGFGGDGNYSGCGCHG